MSDKAVSPLIATVLVIGFAIALSGIMITWGTSFVKDIQERSEKSSLKDIACTRDVGLNIKSATVLGNKIKLVIENLGQMDIDKFNILIVGSDDGDNIETGTGISAGGIQSFLIALDPNKIGTFKQVEAMPSITFEGEQIACKDAVDKEENLGMDTDGLVAYYKLDGDAKDSAGNNNGIINGNPANVNGVFGSALNFDGVGDYVNLGTDPLLIGTQTALTVSVWVKPTVAPTYQHHILSNLRDCCGNYYGYGIFLYSGNTWYFKVGDGTNRQVTAVYAPDQLNKWTHLLLTFDGTTLRGYKDGNLAGSTPSGNIQSSNNHLDIGKSGFFSNWLYFIGAIDEVKIYNKAKTY